MIKNKNSLFKERVQKVVQAIPRGETMSYGEVAKCAGNPAAGRAVGTIMANNYDENIPCHRVIRSDGKVGNYNRGGIQKKIELLRKEGAIKQTGKVSRFFV